MLRLRAVNLVLDMILVGVNIQNMACFVLYSKPVLIYLVIRLKVDGDPVDFYRIGSSLVPALTAKELCRDA